jgi:hypothetical protein
MTTSIFKIKVTDIASELSTRPVGVEARKKLIQALEEFESIDIDFMNRSLTPSFADECIGRLAAILGLNEFKSRVKLSNLTESTKPLVKHVILTRCSNARR